MERGRKEGIKSWATVALVGKGITDTGTLGMGLEGWIGVFLWGYRKDIPNREKNKSKVYPSVLYPFLLLECIFLVGVWEKRQVKGMNNVTHN